MSKFNTVVPVPLGEIRCLDGKLSATTLPGQLVTAVGKFDAGSSKHTQPDYPNATFTLNDGDTKGLLIVMDQEEIPDMKISDAFPKDSHARAHVLKAGEEVTVILNAAAAVAAGTLLQTTSAGKVEAFTGGTGKEPLFSAIETAGTGSTGDELRILARVL